MFIDEKTQDQKKANSHNVSVNSLQEFQQKQNKASTFLKHI